MVVPRLKLSYSIGINVKAKHWALFTELDCKRETDVAQSHHSDYSIRQAHTNPKLNIGVTPN
jgi:hypothetical protein